MRPTHILRPPDFHADLKKGPAFARLHVRSRNTYELLRRSLNHWGWLDSTQSKWLKTEIATKRVTEPVILS